MTRRSLLPIATVLLFLGPSPVVADVALPGTVYLVPHLRFENLDDYPDHVFYLYYRRGSGNPYSVPLSLARVESRKPIPLTGHATDPRFPGHRYADLGLIAVPRSVLPPLAEDRDDDWLAFVEGTHHAKIPDHDLQTDAFLFTLCDHYVTPYRIALREDGSIALTRLPDEAVGRWIYLVVIFAALASTVLGIRWVRRHRRAQALLFPTKATPPFAPSDVG